MAFIQTAALQPDCNTAIVGLVSLVRPSRSISSWFCQNQLDRDLEGQTNEAKGSVTQTVAIFAVAVRVLASQAAAATAIRSTLNLPYSLDSSTWFLELS